MKRFCSGACTCIFALCLLLCSCKKSELALNQVEIYAEDNYFCFSANSFKHIDNTTTTYDALLLLEEHGYLDFEVQRSQLGHYLLSVNGVTAQDGHFWALYTTIVEWNGFTYSTVEYTPFECNGVVLYSSTVGLSSLPIIDGQYYALLLCEVGNE